MSSVLPSLPAFGTPERRPESLPTNARPEQRAAFHRRQEQDITRINENMRAQRARVLADLDRRQGLSR